MFELAPVFRFFTRAFVLVSVCLFPSRAQSASPDWSGGWAIATASAARSPSACSRLMALEYTNAPPHSGSRKEAHLGRSRARVSPLNRRSPHYPGRGRFLPRSLYYMFWQTKHRHPTVNPPVANEAVALAASIGSPDDPASGEALHRAGVDYAIVHTRLPPQTRAPYQPELPDDSMPPDTGAVNPWFRIAARTPDAIVYRVLDAPRRASGAIARPTSGFGQPEPEGRSRARWLEARKGTLTLYVAGQRRPLQLALTLSSFAQPRRVFVRFNGHLASAFEAPPGAYVTRRVKLGSPSPGRHLVEIEAAPGPQSIQAVTGSPDPRSVSIRLREPIVVLAVTR